MKKHPTTVSNKSSLQHLAEEIGNLRYDVLAEFLTHLSRKIHADGEKDEGRGRVKLAASLFEVSQALEEAAVYTNKALTISKPFMKDEFGE